MDNADTATGRAKTVLVLGEGDAAVAVISTVVAQAIRPQSRRRIRFVGPATFAAKTKKHIGGVLLPIVERITTWLELPRGDFVLSVANPGATSVGDLGVRVSGFSADTPVLLALLSAALQIPIPDDIVTTGHIASSDGDMAPVASMPAKTAASIADPSIRRFVYAFRDDDTSLDTLTPSELERMEVAVIEARTEMRTTAVGDIADLVQEIFTNEAIVVAALRKRFFDVRAPHVDLRDPVSRILVHLILDNDSRFWNALERRLMAGNSEPAKGLLREWACFHRSRGLYPAGFGHRLLQLVRSIPPAVRRLKTTFPLLPMHDCIALSQSAQASDYEDVRLLHDAAFGKSLNLQVATEKIPRRASDKVTGPAAAALDTVLAEIEPTHLARKIGLPIDSARASYTLNAATVETTEEFLDTIAAFYLHLIRHTSSVPIVVESNTAAADALELLEEAFARHGGFEAARAESRDGTRGGVRFVLDMMTDQYKWKAQANHVGLVFKEAIDPMAWEEREGLIRELLQRLAPHLPDDLKSQPADRFARQYEAVIQAYVDSIAKVTSVLHRL